MTLPSVFRKTCLATLIAFAGATHAFDVSVNEQHVKAGEPWKIFQDTRVNTLILEKGAAIQRPGKSVTMLVDGKETAMLPGKYNNVELVITDKFYQSPTGKNDRGVDNFRTALLITEKGIDDKRSVIQAIKGGEYSASEAKDIKMVSDSGNFNGVMVDGNVSYRVDGANVDFRSDADGSDNSDFSGYGAAFAAYNGARLAISNSNIDVSGVARLALYAYEDADLLITDSTFKVDGGELYEGYPNSADFSAMLAPPWVLGIKGSARGTNMMGNRTTFTMVRSEAEAANWGVLSTDMGAAMLMTIVDSSLTLNGEKDLFSTRYGSGYGSYILGSEHFYYGVTIHAGTYGGIVREGEAYYGDSTFDEPLNIYPRLQIPTGETFIDFFGNEQQVFDIQIDETPAFSKITGKGKKSYIYSDNFGWMSHGDGKLVIAEGTEVKTGKSTFLLKDGNVDITVKDRSELTPGNGVLLQMMDNDDMLVGIDPESQVALHFNTTFTEKAGYPGIDYSLESVTDEKRANVTLKAEGIKLEGNIYNATGYFGNQPGDKLTVTMGEKSVIIGAISSTSAIHVDENGNQNTHFTDAEYYYLGHVKNKPFFNGVNDIEVVLEDTGVWLVTEESIVTSLTISEGAEIKAKNGKLSMTVDGKVTPVKPGKYEGIIKLTVSS